jgi:hypothetical protein
VISYTGNRTLPGDQLTAHGEVPLSVDNERAGTGSAWLIDKTKIGGTMARTRVRWRRPVLAAMMTLAVLLLGSPLAGAAASPSGNANWILLEGECNGEPALLLDPKGGNTAFLVGGSVGAGMHFRATDAATGELLMENVQRSRDSAGPTVPLPVPLRRRADTVGPDRCHLRGVGTADTTRTEDVTHQPGGAVVP